MWGQRVQLGSSDLAFYLFSYFTGPVLFFKCNDRMEMFLSALGLKYIKMSLVAAKGFIYKNY